MKKIILIDDDINKVLEIFGNIYKLLWKGKDEEGIASKVIFLGNQFKHEKEYKDLSSEDIKHFESVIRNMLRAHCRNEEMWDYNDDMYKNKRKLIDNIVAGISSDDTTNEIMNIIKQWENNEELDSKESYRQIDMQPLISLIQGEGKQEEKFKNYILVDVILLLDDIEKIENDRPIMSMGLYSAVKKQNQNCFLYSGYAYDYPLIQKYKKVYQDKYGEQIEVYSSKMFFSKQVNSEKCLFYYLNQ